MSSYCLLNVVAHHLKFYYVVAESKKAFGRRHLQGVRLMWMHMDKGRG